MAFLACRRPRNTVKSNVFEHHAQKITGASVDTESREEWVVGRVRRVFELRLPPKTSGPDGLNMAQHGPDLVHHKHVLSRPQGKSRGFKVKG